METDGFYGLFIAPLSCLSLPDRRGRPTDRPSARTYERGVSENLVQAAADGELLSILTCRLLPPSPLPPSAAKKSLSNDNLGVFCYLEDGEGSGNSLQSYERAELNLAAEKTDFLGQRE